MNVLKSSEKLLGCICFLFVVLILDMKPSDAFALALRMNSSIYINKMLLDDAGVNIC
ncbi:MAG: bifunctional nuclease domain-containing protein [Candidatus Aenigmatarchaeota archaeon]